jgi:hypothetical protein
VPGSHGTGEQPTAISPGSLFYLQDTSHNVIEVKTYRNLADTFGEPIMKLAGHEFICYNG